MNRGWKRKDMVKEIQTKQFFFIKETKHYAEINWKGEEKKESNVLE